MTYLRFGLLVITVAAALITDHVGADLPGPSLPPCKPVGGNVGLGDMTSPAKQRVGPENPSYMGPRVGPENPSYMGPRAGPENPGYMGPLYNDPIPGREAPERKSRGQVGLKPNDDCKPPPDPGRIFDLSTDGKRLR
jgi:hypothetical protein